MRSVLIISPEAWSAHTVSKHHYAMTLAAQGVTVYFLDPPDNTLTDIRIEAIAGHQRLHLVTGPQLARGLRFYPSVLRRWLERRWLSRLEAVAGQRIDTIWLFENSRFFDMNFAGDRLRIYHQVDLNQDFSAKWAATTADICFCTTDLIRQALLPYSSRVYKIHHGLAQVANSTPLAEEQQRHFQAQGPHAVYIGNLEMEYLDVELLARVVKHAADVTFHFVGGFRQDGPLRTQTSALTNLIWWGKVDSRVIPSILDRADVLLVTYQAARYKDQASPHKFMEYLASGKTIVATYTAEYRDKRELLEMVDDSSEYIAAFDRVVSQLTEYNGPVRQAARKAFAQAHTYEKQIDKIQALLKQHQLLSD